MTRDSENDDDDKEEPTGGDIEEQISLEDLTNCLHPCLAEGDFSIYHSPQVREVLNPREVTYSIDLDGVIVLSK